MKFNLVLTIHRCIVAAIAVVNLAFCTVYSRAISPGLVDSAGVGFAMFMTILFGLVCFFNVTRLKEVKLVSFITNIVCLLIVIGFSVLLLTSFMTGEVANQAEINNGIVLAIISTSVYVVGLVTLIVSKFIK